MKRLCVFEATIDRANDLVRKFLVLLCCSFNPHFSTSFLKFVLLVDCGRFFMLDFFFIWFLSLFHRCQSFNPSALAVLSPPPKQIQSPPSCAWMLNTENDGTNRRDLAPVQLEIPI